MSDASSLSPEDRFIGLFIGRSGSGKKAAACTFPHPIKYLDFDGRIRGLLGCPWVERKGIDYKYYPPRPSPGYSLFQTLNVDLEAIQIQANSGQLPFKTLVVASLTGESIALLAEAVPMTHAGTKGKKLGVLNMPGPADYGFQSVAMHDIMSFLRSLPYVNIIVTAHIVPRFGKPPGDDNEYAEKVEVGERLALTDKLAETMPAFFDNIIKFSKAENGNKTLYYARFRGDMPRTTFANLPDGDVDVTNKNFWEYLKTKGVKATDAGN